MSVSLQSRFKFSFAIKKINLLQIFSNCSLGTSGISEMITEGLQG